MIVEIDGVRFDVPDDATPDEIAAITAPPAPEMGKGEAFVRGAFKGGSFATFDEGAGGVAALAKSAQAPWKRTPGPLALAKLYPGVPYAEAASRWFNENRPDLSSAAAAEKGRQEAPAAYRETRDAIRASDRAALSERPGWNIFGNVVGGLGPSLMIPGAASVPGLGLGARMLAGAKAAAPVGAAYGYGGSESESIPGQVLDTAVGAGGAAIAGAALPLAAAAVRPAASALRKWMSEAAINQGRKVLTGNAAPMATRKPLSEEAVRAAYEVGAIRPLGTVEKAAEKLGAARESLGEQYAQIVAALESKGVTGPNAVLLARRLVEEANAISTQSLGSPAPGMFRSAAEELASKVNPAPFASKRLGLSQAENMKRTLQRAAQSEYVKEGAQSLAGEAKTDLASILRQAIEDEVQAQAQKAPAEAAAFEPVKRQLSATIEASKAAERAAARAANRQQFGLGSKVLAGGALASGSVPGAVATLLGANALRNRGPATFGSIANLLSRASGAAADVTPQAVSRTARVASPTISDEVAGLIAYLRNLRPQLVPTAADEEP